MGAKDGGDLRAYFVGNAPAGHVAAGVGLGGAPPGGTIFVHRAQLLSRADGVELQGSSAGVETAWIARDEVDRYADSEEARVFLHKLLID